MNYLSTVNNYANTASSFGLNLTDTLNNVGVGTGVMMSAGGFKFSISTAAYQSLTQSFAWKWASIEQFGQTDALHSTGDENPTISLEGTVYTQFGNVGNRQIDKLIQIGNNKTPILLATGLGDVMGYWVVTSVVKTQVEFLKNGASLKETFQMEFLYYGKTISNT
ncbi:MAG: phage tail protein [Vibrio sp.]